MAYLSYNADIRCIQRIYSKCFILWESTKILKLYENYKDFQLQKTTAGSKIFMKYYARNAHSFK